MSDIADRHRPRSGSIAKLLRRFVVRIDIVVLRFRPIVLKQRPIMIDQVIGKESRPLPLGLSALDRR